MNINQTILGTPSNTLANAITETSLEVPCPQCNRTITMQVARVNGAEVYYVTHKDEKCASCGLVLEKPTLIRFLNGKFVFYH